MKRTIDVPRPKPEARTANTLAVLALLVAPACTRHALPDKPLTPVEVVQVATHTASNGARYSASVKPNWQIDLAFRVGGYVDNVRAQEGDRVRRGAILATLRESDYAAKVSAARSQVAEATAGATKAGADFDRAQKLFAAAALTKPDLEAARAQHDAAAARLQMAEASLRDAQLAYGDASLVAPADAVVLRRNIERGSLAGPGVPVFSIADTSTVRVAFGVPDLVVAKMKNGDALDVAVEALHHTFRGRVSRIAPSADPKSRMFEVEITIPNQSGELKPGMIASLQSGDAPVLATVVPLDAIVRVRNDYAVYVVDATGAARARRVVLGDMIGNAVAVTDGVTGGDRVITRGATIVADGEKVQVLP